MADDDLFEHHMDALATSLGRTNIDALERRAHATLATTLFLRELYDPDFAGDGDADWASRLAHIADALGVGGTLVGMLEAADAE